MKDEEQKQLSDLQAQLALAKSNVEKLKEQLARVATDNEVLSEQNGKLHDEAHDARRQAQEFAQMNDLLVKKAQRLEQDNVELGTQRDRFKESFERSQRQIAELVQRLERQKLVTPVEPTIVNG